MDGPAARRFQGGPTALTMPALYQRTRYEKAPLRPPTPLRGAGPCASRRFAVKGFPLRCVRRSMLKHGQDEGIALVLIEQRNRERERAERPPLHRQPDAGQRGRKKEAWRRGTKGGFPANLATIRPVSKVENTMKNNKALTRP